jgi:diadenosine tetraphosphate (Ap4A) HIT family hydrolase
MASANAREPHRLPRPAGQLRPARSELALSIADAYPVSEGHSLVIPRHHVADGLELRREQLSTQDATISGWAGLLNSRGG